MTEQSIFENQYSESSFWDKCANSAKSAGKTVIEQALQLYYAAQRPETPMWAKAQIYASLGYLISPVDVVPDITPIVGFTDDAAILAAAIATCALHITQEVKAQAAQKIKDWFG